MDGIFIREPAILLERPCAFQRFQDAACDEVIDHLDEPIASGRVGKQVNPTLFEGVLDLSQVNALILCSSTMAFISLSMTLSGIICANSYNPFDPAFGASLYETHMIKQIGDEIVDQIPAPSATPISCPRAALLCSFLPLTHPQSQDLVESTM